MENTVIGGAQVNPRELLDEGLRKELVRHVSELLNNLIQFDFAADSETVASMTKHQAAAMRSIASLAGRLEGFKAALECVEDYVCMNGLKMWHEELSRIMNYNVEQEVRPLAMEGGLCNTFLCANIPTPLFHRSINIFSRKSWVPTRNSNRILSPSLAFPELKMNHPASHSWEEWYQC